jgi:hypothetical protein
MKKRTLLFFLFLAALIGAEEPSRSLWDYHPLHMGGNLLRLGGAEVTPRKSHEDGKLYFRKSNVFLNMLVPVSETTYFFPRVEWNTFTLDWSQNPKFHSTHFYYAQFGLMMYSTGLEKWRWIARIDYNIDLEHFSQPGPYGLLTGLLWGAYQVHRKWHYHVGAVAYSGMEGQMVYPIVGLDYSPDKKWTFQAIFPIDYSIQYHAAPWCRLSLKARPLKERFRVGNHEPEPRAIFNYSTIGTEFNVHFEKTRRFEIELYGGYNFGGSFYIKSQGGHNPYYTDLGGAIYGGATLDYGF